MARIEQWRMSIDRKERRRLEKVGNRENCPSLITLSRKGLVPIPMAFLNSLIDMSFTYHKCHSFEVYIP